MKKRWLWWIPAILVMGLIFWFSQMDGPDSAALSGGTVRRLLRLLARMGTLKDQEQLFPVLETLVRKAAHAAEYALLGGCLVLPFAFHLQKRGRALFALPLAASVVYACSDELHQLFIAERAGRILDIGIDSGGACLGILLALFLLRKNL